MKKYTAKEIARKGLLDKYHESWYYYNGEKKYYVTRRKSTMYSPRYVSEQLKKYNLPETPTILDIMMYNKEKKKEYEMIAHTRKSEKKIRKRWRSIDSAYAIESIIRNGWLLDPVTGEPYNSTIPTAGEYKKLQDIAPFDDGKVPLLVVTRLNEQAIAIYKSLYPNKEPPKLPKYISRNYRRKRNAKKKEIQHPKITPVHAQEPTLPPDYTSY